MPDDGWTTIGSDPSNDIVVDDEYASRFHCRVMLVGPGIAIVEDVGSTNGLHINGQPVPLGVKGVLRRGDVLRVGRTEFPLWRDDSDSFSEGTGGGSKS